MSSDNNLAVIQDIPLKVTAVLGSAVLKVAEVVNLVPGAVIPLERKVGEPVDIYVNEKLVARGEVSVVEERIAITLSEIVRD